MASPFNPLRLKKGLAGILSLRYIYIQMLMKIGEKLRHRIILGDKINPFGRKLEKLRMPLLF